MLGEEGTPTAVASAVPDPWKSARYRRSVRRKSPSRISTFCPGSVFAPSSSTTRRRSRPEGTASSPGLLIERSIGSGQRSILNRQPAGPSRRTPSPPSGDSPDLDLPRRSRARRLRTRTRSDLLLGLLRGVQMATSAIPSIRPPRGPPRTRRIGTRSRSFECLPRAPIRLTFSISDGAQRRPLHVDVRRPCRDHLCRSVDRASRHTTPSVPMASSRHPW